MASLRLRVATQSKFCEKKVQDLARLILCVELAQNPLRQELMDLS